jgi:hypothetical protein
LIPLLLTGGFRCCGSRPGWRSSPPSRWRAARAITPSCGPAAKCFMSC